MPTSAEILSSLELITNKFMLAGILWHLIIYMAIIIIAATNFRFSRKAVCLMSAIPFASVALFAFWGGNIFNCLSYSLLTMLFIVIGLRLTKEKVSLSALPYRSIGILLMIFGLWYPHFVHTGSIFTYLYAAPVALIPCPTLSLVIGFALVYKGFRSNSAQVVLICYGFFYGLFGVAKLGVILDVTLLMGTIVLLIHYLQNRKKVILTT